MSPPRSKSKSPKLVATAVYSHTSRPNASKKFSKKTSKHKSQSKTYSKQLTVGEHLEELRLRLIALLLIVFCFSVIAFAFSKRLHAFFIQPYSQLTNQKLLLHNVYGSLEVMLKISIMSGIAVSMPICLYIVWGFITPALRKKTAWIGRLSVAVSSFLFWTGLWVAWQYIFPMAMDFLFQDMQLVGVSPQTSVEKYYSFLFMLHIGCGFVFQLPLLTILLGGLGILQTSWHRKWWKYILLVTLVFSAFITPPDPLSQMALTSLLISLYAFSVAVVFVLEKCRP